MAGQGRSWISAALVAVAFGGLLAGGAAAQTSAPSDPQIAHIAYTAEEADIANARQALRKSHNGALRTFARDRVRDHTAVNKEPLAPVKKLGVTPEDNPTSQSIAEQQKDKRAQLSGLKRAAFDKA